MSERIRIVGKRHKMLRDISARLPRVDPHEVQKALGAEPANTTLGNTTGPITTFLVRQETARRVQSEEAE